MKTYQSAKRQNFSPIPYQIAHQNKLMCDGSGNSPQRHRGHRGCTEKSTQASVPPPCPLCLCGELQRQPPLKPNLIRNLALPPLSSRLHASFLLFILLTLLLAWSSPAALAQKARAAAGPKLPAPETIVGDYLKKVGGKKRLAGVKDAIYDWTVDRLSLPTEAQPITRARTQEKAPASTRTDFFHQSGESNAAASTRSAWMRGLDGSTRTLTDAEAGAAKLQSALDASQLIDYKKLNVLARTVGQDTWNGEPAYIVEFSTREGARLRYWFGQSSKLLLKIEDDARLRRTHFSDYRSENGLLEPHRIVIKTGQRDAEIARFAEIALVLQSVRYNVGVSDALFDPPKEEALDIPALLREVESNQRKIDERIAEYSYQLKSTDREINGRGEVTKETVKVFEVYPLSGRRAIWKLISENGVPLSPERAAERDKKIAEGVAKFEREQAKAQEKREREAAENKGDKEKDKDDDVGIADFLRVCEFVSPRRERFRDRDTVVFDFRPRAGYRPRNRVEDIVTKLVGVAWIDWVDKRIVRLEAKLDRGYKMGGGLVASVRPGSGAVFEQIRLPDGVWLPRFAQINFGVKLFLFAGQEANLTREYSDYRRAKTNVEDYKLDEPDKAKP